MSKSQFCQVCPRKLSSFPDKPCPLALQSMEAIRSGDLNSISCPYYVNAIDSNFCFFQYMDSEMPTEGIDSNRKIAQMLLMSEKEVSTTLNNAVEKLKEGGEDVELFAEIIGESNQYADESIYSTDHWFTEVTGKHPDEVPVESLEPGKPGRKRKAEKMTGHTGAGAVHKSGKIQLHNLSDNWHKHVKEWQKGSTPIRMAKHNLKKKKNEEEDDKKD